MEVHLTLRVDHARHSQIEEAEVTRHSLKLVWPALETLKYGSSVFSATIPNNTTVVKCRQTEVLACRTPALLV